MRRVLVLTLALLLAFGQPAWATFPTVAATSISTDVVNDTDHVISLPASIGADDLLLLVHHGSATDASPNTACTGWTLLADGIQTSAVGHTAVFYKVASGSEGATVTCTTDLAEDSAGCVYRITNWDDTTPPEISTVAVGSSTSPDPTAVTPSWGAEDTKFIAIASSDLSLTDFTAYPALYGASNITIATHTAAGGACAMAARDLNATSDDPGAFTTDEPAAWVAFTVAVRTDNSAVAAARSPMLGVW